MQPRIFVKSLLLVLIFMTGWTACTTKKEESALAPGVESTAPSELLAAGTITVAPELTAEAPRLGVLFIMARNAKGQLVAVKRMLPPFQYPVSFELTSRDQMMADIPVGDTFTLTARLDKDGNANPAQPGDIVSRASYHVKKGRREVRITLDDLIK